jgi:hypothetical protein
LNVAGLITTGVMNANTVFTNTVTPAAITTIQNFGVNSETLIRLNPVLNTFYAIPSFQATELIQPFAYVDLRYNFNMGMNYTGFMGSAEVIGLRCQMIGVNNSSGGIIIFSDNTYAMRPDPSQVGLTFLAQVISPGEIFEVGAIPSPQSFTFSFRVMVTSVPFSVAVTRIFFDSAILISQQVKR